MQNQNAEKTVQEIVRRKTVDLMNTSFQCVCGRTHHIPMKYLSVDTGAVGEVRARMDKLGFAGKGAIVSDKKIEEIVVKDIARKLTRQGLSFDTYPVGDGSEKIPAEIEQAQQIADRIRGKPDYLVSIGSGVISDLTKYAAFLLDLPYLLIATAPSMNGYTSSMAALTDRGIKQTLLVHPARAIFADIDVLRNAPLEMIQAGLGDIVSKSVCNADWKLSQSVKKTYFCPVPFRITDKTEQLYLEAAEEIGRRTEYGVTILTDGIMRSGLSMTVIGTSTPSSGAEHALSHYWDLLALMEGKDKLLHGVQVGVTTLIILRFYDWLRNYPIKKRISLEKLRKVNLSGDQLGELLGRKFGSFAEAVEKQCMQKWVDWEQKRREIEHVLDTWDSIWDELDPYLRPIRPVEDALRKSGSATHFSHLGKKRDDVVDALLYARLIRGRYTILDLAADLGILQEGAEKILE